VIVTSAIDQAALNELHIPINVIMIQQLSDWTTRQWITYWSIMECIREDFLGLDDWAQQIINYSAANPEFLSGPLSAISPPQIQNYYANALTAAKETPMLGSDINVGLPLPTIVGFNEVFTLTPDQTSDIEGLSSLVG
jgi:hypothetical protein